MCLGLKAQHWLDKRVIITLSSPGSHSIVSQNSKFTHQHNFLTYWWIQLWFRLEKKRRSRNWHYALITMWIDSNLSQRRLILIFEANFLFIKKGIVNQYLVSFSRGCDAVSFIISGRTDFSPSVHWCLLGREQHHQDPPPSIFRVLGESLCITITFPACLHASSSRRDAGGKKNLGEGWTVRHCCSDKYCRRKFRLMDAGRVGVMMV